MSRDCHRREPHAGNDDLVSTADAVTSTSANVSTPVYTSSTPLEIPEFQNFVNFKRCSVLFVLLGGPSLLFETACLFLVPGVSLSPELSLGYPSTTVRFNPAEF